MQRKSFYNNLYPKSTHLKLTSHSLESFQIDHQKSFSVRFEKHHNTLYLLYELQNGINHSAMDKRILFSHVHILILFVFFIYFILSLFYIFLSLIYFIPYKSNIHWDFIIVLQSNRF